jgi:hypothetical protein
MKHTLAVMLLATYAVAQQRPTVPCFVGQLNDGTACKDLISEPPTDPAKPTWTPSPALISQQAQATANYQEQIQLRNQAAFTPVATATRTPTLTHSSYVPPPQLTPLQQPSDNFSATAGYPLGAAMTRGIQVHRMKSFVKKYCKSNYSGAAWWYQFGDGERFEGVCE